MDILKIKMPDGSWASIPAITGPKGDKGEPGKDGAPGAKGEQGLPGKDGALGPAGADGKQGPQGEPGKDGANGTNGKDGAEGKQGPAGKDGANGTDGFSPVATVTETETGATISIQDKTGTTTATIKNGKDGKDGAKGDTGDIGPQGPVGAAGSVGPKGDTGDKGADGQPGKDGAKGADATINGVNTLELVLGKNITLSQSGNQLTISAADGGGSGGSGGWHFTDDRYESDLYNAKIVIITHSDIKTSHNGFMMCSSIWSANGQKLGDIPYKQHKVYMLNLDAPYDSSYWWSYDGSKIQWWGWTPNTCFIAYYY